MHGDHPSGKPGKPRSHGIGHWHWSGKLGNMTAVLFICHSVDSNRILETCRDELIYDEFNIMNITNEFI